MRDLSRILVVLLLVGVVAASLGVASNAIWTDTVTVDKSAFTTGSIDISTSRTTALVTYEGMAPADSTGGQSLTVSNDGSLELRYAVTVEADNKDGKNLRDELVLTVREEGTDCKTFDGTQLYTGSLNPTGGKVIGDPAQGLNLGDRTLAPSASEVLCFKVDLPKDAPDSVQSASTDAPFTFSAEQTANNGLNPQPVPR